MWKQQKNQESTHECYSMECSPDFALLYCRFILLVRDNATIIIVIDILLDLIRLQSIYQCLDLRQILVAFLYSDNVYISSCCLRISTLE